jgi:hypothetical protein
MLFADTWAMPPHLDDIAATVAKGSRAFSCSIAPSGHTTDRLVVPKNLCFVSQPSHSHELNPVENVWQQASWY